MLAALLLTGCMSDSPPQSSATPPTPTGGLPISGHLVGYSETYSIVKARPNSGMLVVQVPEYIYEKGRMLDVSLMIVGGDGTRAESVYRIDAGQVRSYHWFNFSYPDSPPPYLVHTSGNSPDVFLRNQPAVETMRGEDNFVIDESCDHPEHQRCSYIKAEYPRVGAEAQTPLRDEATFEVNATMLTWDVFPGPTTLRGTVYLYSPSGREIVRLESNGNGYTGGHLSDGSRPIEKGIWRLVIEGTGSVEFRLDRWHLSPAAWEHYGFQKVPS